MHQYTTPTLTLTLADVDFATVATFRVAIENDGAELLKIIPASDASVDATNHTIAVTLTQEETAAFSLGGLWIQVRIIFTDDSVMASEKKRIEVKDVLDEVIV